VEVVEEIEEMEVAMEKYVNGMGKCGMWRGWEEE